MDSLSTILKLSTSSIALVLISIFYKIGIWTRISGSKFIERNDDKKKLLQETSKNIFSVNNSIIEAIINTIPYFLMYITLYLFVRWFDIYHYIPMLTNKGGIAGYLVLPVIEIFQYGFVLFGMISSGITVHENGNISYDYQWWYYCVIYIIGLSVLKIDTFINKNTYEIMWKTLQINNIHEYNISLVYSLIVYFTYIILIKPFTRFIVSLEQNLYLDKLEKRIEQNETSLYGMTMILVSIICILTSVFFIINIISKTGFFIPFGDLIIVVFMILRGSVLAGQRIEFLSHEEIAQLKF